MRGSETSVWGTRFGPSASGTRDDGKPFYVPDIATADADFVCHWSSRANEMTHPILKARYADLVWDAGQPSRGSAATIAWRGSPQTHTSTVQSPSRSKTFLIVAMPFDPGNFQPNLATQNVRQRQGLIITLHRDGLTSDGKLWWMAYDFLIDNAVRFPMRKEMTSSPTLNKFYSAFRMSAFRARLIHR
jgi:hypothetical protein